jgi:hypothetical protein
MVSVFVLNVVVYEFKPWSGQNKYYTIAIYCFSDKYHWGKADDRNCNYGHPKIADVESGKNLFCRLNCFYNVF